MATQCLNGYLTMKLKMKEIFVWKKCIFIRRTNTPDDSDIG